VSHKIRQSCLPELPYPVHTIDAIAFNRKALCRAKVMITHMGFHATVPRGAGQGRAAQLVNPLRTYSRFGRALMIAGRAKSQAAGCNDAGTRRSGVLRRPGRLRARPRSAAPAGRFSAPRSRCAEVDRPVHPLRLRWTALCAPGFAASGARPAAGSEPGVVAGRHPAGRIPRRRRAGRAAAGSGRARPAAGQECTAGVMASVLIGSGKPVPRSPRGNSNFESINARPFIGAAQCTCPAQFTDHAAVR
jgi:hypothetical protein